MTIPPFFDEDRAAAVRSMLEARRVAVVGASGRPGTFGYRMITEISRSPGVEEVIPVNPRYDSILDRPVVESLDAIDGPVDLVLLGVPDRAVPAELERAARRGDRSAVIYASLFDPDDPRGRELRHEVTRIATGANMAVCGGGCMGFVNPAHGLRAIGYEERFPLEAGPVAVVTHSGSVFSALLRTRRQLGFSLVVSAGQELVTGAADYLEYAISHPGTKVVGLVLETMRRTDHLRDALSRAAAADIPVVALTVGASQAGRAMVAAHSGALAGSDGAWEALFEAHGVHRVADLDQLTDSLELFASSRRARVNPGTNTSRTADGLATVHDSGAERALLVDVAEAVGVSFAPLAPATLARLDDLLDPGLVPENPLDVWGTGSDTESLFAGCLGTMADDDAVRAVALAIDLVPEFDGDQSYPRALQQAAAATDKPMVLLSNLASALDPLTASELRSAGIPVLEGTRSGLVALGHLLRHPTAPVPGTHQVDLDRQEKWRRKLEAGPLTSDEGFALLADYRIPTPRSEAAARVEDALEIAHSFGFPVVMKTDEPSITHKSDVGGVVLGVADDDQVRSVWADLTSRLGPRVVVAEMIGDGVELAAGLVRDPHLGAMVVLGAGGVLVEVMADRAVRLPPLGDERILAALDTLRIRSVLDGVRGQAPVDLSALVAAVGGLSDLAAELGDALVALDINPLRCHASGCVALDVLVEASGPSTS